VKVQKTIKSNMICLSRHYNACLRALADTGPTGSTVNVGASKGTVALNYAAVAERVVSALRAARGCTLVEAEVRNTVGMKGNAHKTAWNHVKRALAQQGAVSVRAKVQDRVKTCLHLKSSNDLLTDGSQARPAAELEGRDADLVSASGPQVRAEETVQQQIYNMVIQSGEEGITHTNINRRLRLPTKISYSICCALVAANRLRVVAETIKSQVHYRLIGPAHFRAEKYAPLSATSPLVVEGDGGHAPKTESSKFPRTVQQQQRCDKIHAYVNERRMVWVHDVHQWMKSEIGGDMDLRVLARLFKDLEGEGKVKIISFSTRTSLSQQEKQTQAAFAIGAPLEGPEVQAFLEAKAVKRRKLAEPLKKLDMLRVSVDHLPRIADQSSSKLTAAQLRSRRYNIYTLSWFCFAPRAFLAVNLLCFATQA
jgi:hypothetical protein